MSKEATVTTHEDLPSKTRQRAFTLALRELLVHGDINHKESDMLINHEVIKPMIFRGLMGNWCDSKNHGYVYHLLLADCRQNIQFGSQMFAQIQGRLLQ